MRSLRKNKQQLYYATYNNKVPIIDENGDFTGNHTPGYSEPVFFKANISEGKGNAAVQAFGKYIDFTRSISSTDMSLPIDEYSLIWYETEPVLLADGTADPNSADYEVAAPVARSLNSLLIALNKKRKNVSVK